MGLLGDAWEWTKGAAEDVWGAASGQTTYKAKPYDPANMTAAQDPWLQQLQAAATASPERAYQDRLSADAAELRHGQQPTYDAMGRLVAGFDPGRSPAQLEAVAGRHGQDVARQAGGIEALSHQLGTAPSYADLASRAAMDRASSEATARAASARGPNAALAMRDAAGMSAGAARQAAGEAAALKAQEMSNRFSQRGDLLSRAAGVTGQGAATQGQLYGAAGDQRRAGMTAGVDALGNIAGQRRDDIGTRANITAQAGQLGVQGEQLRQNAITSGLEGATQGQGIIAGSRDSANAANASLAGGNAERMQKTVGGVTEAGGGMLKDVSDIRAKEDVEPLSSSARDYLDIYQPDLRNLPNDWAAPKGSGSVTASQSRDKNAGNVIGRFFSRLGEAVAADKKQAPDAGRAPMFSDERVKTYVDPLKQFAPAGGSSGEDEEDQMSKLIDSAVQAAPMVMAMMSDERSKREIDPIVEMAVNPDANARALDPVNPYRYRYKQSIARAMGTDTEPREGVMAQDLERSEAGAEVVNDGPGLKSLDRNRAIGFSLAGVAGLDKRLKRLERATGATGARNDDAPSRRRRAG